MALLGSADDMVRHLTFGYPTEDEAILALQAVEFRKTLPGAEGGPLMRRLQAYASGHRDDFRDVRVDLGRQTEFRKRVYRFCRTIPYGETLTYGELATLAGSPGAARAVGRAMAANQVPLIVPCHRVKPSSGGLGGFSSPGGVIMKRRLLDLEAGSPTGAGRLG
ncbi:MAG: methylated-DNA--[protein]-cysteine S-methyltransferase [Rhodopirellula sp.]|nr:methylated-DNA--[protein]-cysteine S-methyltransferase [Rhodopirellula sp.]